MPYTYAYAYRMTQDEYEHYLGEHDPLYPEFPNVVHDGRCRVQAAGGQWITDASHARASYDAGFYWMRTSRPVDWM